LFVISSTAEAGHVGTHTYSNKKYVRVFVSFVLSCAFILAEKKLIYASRAKYFEKPYSRKGKLTDIYSTTFQ
jgi:hypothetical protein